MQDYALTVAVVAAVPTTIFAGMMGVAAIALCTHGESPRQVLAMPKTFFRHRGYYQTIQPLPVDRGLDLALDAVGD